MRKSLLTLSGCKGFPSGYENTYSLSYHVGPTARRCSNCRFFMRCIWSTAVGLKAMDRRDFPVYGMSRTDYLRFVAIGVVAVIALSMTHSYWGNPYSRAVMKTVESFIPSQASIRYEDSMLWVTVAPSDVDSQRQNIVTAAKNNPDDTRLASLIEGSEEGVSYTQGFTTKEMSY